MDQPTAEELLTQLERLVGTWSVESRWPGDDEPWPHGGRTTFEWHDSRQHLVQRSTVELPAAPDSVSIIGWTPPTTPGSSSTPTNEACAGSTR